MPKNQAKVKIKDLPKVDRPREKMIKYGTSKLSNSELLAILLRTGKKGENVVLLANKILKKFSSNITNLNYNDLKKYPGLGPAKACEIIACFELGKRLLKSKPYKLLLKPADVFREMKEFRQLKQEHFAIFYLDSRNGEIAHEVISIGTLNASLIHPREVFEPAIRNSTAQIILSHNHPSGDPEPSEDDLEITKRLVNAGKILGIEVIDHVIVTKDGFFSFSERKLI